MMAQPTPMPRAEDATASLLRRQNILDSILNPGGNAGGDGTGDTTSTPSTTTTPTSTSTTTTPTSTSTTSTPTSSSTRATTSERTTSSAQTIATEATSNGIVYTTTLVTQQPVVVTEKPTSTGSADQSGSKSSSSNGGLIGGVVGGVVGGLALLTLLALVLILWRRRKARTGHGWFLCFGRKPNRKDDLDVDWPTFDPTVGAAGVGGTMGGAGRRSGGAMHGDGGTLPNVDDNAYGGYGGSNYEQEGYNDEMRDMGSYSAVGGAAPSYVSPTSDGTHYRQSSQQWHPATMASFSQNAHSPEGTPSAPDYSHLDAPEVREERARQQAQAEAQAQAMAAAAAAGGFSRGTSTSPPPPLSQQPSMRYSTPGSPGSLTGGGASSPPPDNQRPLSTDHRLSQGTQQMLADNNFFLPAEESGTVFSERPNQRLQLHNPDA